MSLQECLGLSFKLQKFVTIPNYGEKSWTIGSLGRVLPILVCTCATLSDIIHALIVPRVPQVEDSSVVSGTVSKMDYMVNCMGLILIVILGFHCNSDHLTMYIHINGFGRRLLWGQAEMRKRQLKNNRDVCICIFYNISLSIAFMYINFATYDLRSGILYIIYMITMCVSDTITVYIVHVYKEIYTLARSLRLRELLWKNELNTFLLLTDFLNIIPLLNSALGELTFLTFIQHIICSSLSSYIIFWTIFDTNMPLELFIFCIACIFWLIRSTGCIIYLSISGNNLSDEVKCLSFLIPRRILKIYVNWQSLFIFKINDGKFIMNLQKVFWNLISRDFNIYFNHIPDLSFADYQPSSMY